MSEDIEDRECSECGTTGEWREWEDLEIQYPENRSRDKNKTTRRVFDCRSCGAQGLMFEDGWNSSIQFSGALR